MVSDGEPHPFRSTLFPVDDQWLIVGTMTAGVLLVETSVPELTRLPMLAS